MLASGLSVLARPGHCLQCGILPDHATVIPLPQRVNAGQAAIVLNQARQPIPRAHLIAQLGHCGIPRTHATGIVAELTRAGVLRLVPDAAPLLLLHTGRASTDIHLALQRRGVASSTVTDLSQLISLARLPGPDVALLTGMVFPPPDMLLRLMEHRIPHFPCGVVDGRIIAGPLVLPGTTPCLTCVDAHYAQQDAAWKIIRVQATGRPQGLTSDQSAQLALFMAGLVETELNRWRLEWRADPATPPPARLLRRLVLEPRDLQLNSVGFARDPACPACAVAQPEPASIGWPSDDHALTPSAT